MTRIGISKEYKLSPQKIDVVFAANCVGHHVLTTHLLPLLRQTVSQNKTNDARIVVTSSSLHSFCRELNFDLLASPKPPKNRFVDGIWRYARSKLGNILWTRELNRRLLRDDDPASRRIYVNIFFPGNIVTDQWSVWSEILGSLLGAVMQFVFRVIGQSTEDGAATAMFLGASRRVVDDDIRGRYFIPIATPDATTKIAEDGELARDLWAYLESLCHGGAIFPGIIDSSTGKSVIAGRKVTGFTTRGEEEEGVLDTIKSWSRPTIESSAAAACGANYVSPAGPWDAFTVTDGDIVTSANPASAHVTAEAAVNAFDAL
ncbi:predicted protein [Aspergillus terreus NIH2624]|uniref:Uncharacterized protein n=1 Tax=Aspergillus terreus (strain NIH 2624 / FGSC A1156) TaxID=341663 RepID=Q0CHH4_ASPTN|nr:uncharacterized protein ATEG_06868 [Aspergillus terreus NIH2624]EAU32252.1 predicted protein [Aspergillus terreus NIH2624]